MGTLDGDVSPKEPRIYTGSNLLNLLGLLVLGNFCVLHPLAKQVMCIEFCEGDEPLPPRRDFSQLRTVPTVTRRTHVASP